MPTPTYDLIASNVLSSSASSVTFSSISASYRDLILVFEAQASTSALNIRFNSDTGSNYNRVWMNGDGTDAESGTNSARSFLDLTFETNFSNGTPVLFQLHLMDYSTTDKHKTALSRFDQANTATGANAHRWASTSAINAIEVYSATGTINSGATFYLYGIVS